MNQFNCTKCGACCKLVSPELLITFNLPFSEKGGCGYLKEDNSCEIYENRPNVCNVKYMFDSHHSKKMTWEEYTRQAEAACAKLLDKVNKND